MGQVNMKMVDAKVVGKYVKKFKLNVGSGLDERVDALQKHFIGQREKLSLAECDCGGISDEELPECPFCGDSEEVNASAEQQPQAAEPEPKEDDAPQQPTFLEPSPAGTNLASNEDNVLPAPSMDDLQRCEKVVKRAGKMAAEQIFEIGNALREINDRELWKLHVNEKGKPVHRGFKAYVTNEFSITPAYAYDLIGVAERFSLQQIRDMGITKLLKLKNLEDRGDTMDDEEEGTPPDSRSNPNAVTIAVVMKKHTLSAYKRQPPGNTDAPQHAKDLKDEPCSTLTLENGVELRVLTKKNKKGELQHVIEFKRVKE